MVLFLVLSALWLAAAGTARVWNHSTPGCFGPACPPPPSGTGLHVWFILGIAGAVLTLTSLVLLARRAVRGRRQAGAGRRLRWVVVTGFAGALAEVILVLLVTHVAIATAPLGFEYSGEAAVAIGILGLAQPAVAGALALAWGRLLRASPGGPGPGTSRIRSWTAVPGLAGMVLGSGAFAAWSLRDGTIEMLVSTRLIAGTGPITNAGAWWPGLFSAMVALTLLAAACAPGLASASGGGIPPGPAPGGRSA